MRTEGRLFAEEVDDLVAPPTGGDLRRERVGVGLARLHQVRHIVGEGIFRLPVVCEARLEVVAHEFAVDGLAAFAGNRLAVHVRLERAKAGDRPVGLLH